MSKIKFVRTYSIYEIQLIDIIYKSGKIRTTVLSDAPQTALSFMEQAEKKEQYDAVFKRGEVIYQ